MTITIKNPQSELKTNHDKKERIASRYGLGINQDGQIEHFLELRLYVGRSSHASTIYADLWVHCSGIHASANGQAGGHGYCKQSAASHVALSAIFGGFDTVSGRGMSCVDDVIKRIGVEVFGLSNVIVLG